MKIPTYDRPQEGEVENMPDGFYDEILSPMSSQIERLTQALQGRTTISENISAEVRDITLSNDTLTTIELQQLRRVSPSGVLLLEARCDGYPEFHWTRAGIGKVKVRVRDAENSPTTIVCRILVLG